jgi:hypothetical protein
MGDSWITRPDDDEGERVYGPLLNFDGTHKRELKLVQYCRRNRHYRPARRMLGVPVTFLPLGAVYYLCLVTQSAIPALALVCGAAVVLGLYFIADR